MNEALAAALVGVLDGEREQGAGHGGAATRDASPAVEGGGPQPGGRLVEGAEMAGRVRTAVAEARASPA
eukprot:4568896-Pleurochrysis_carterae.AAC.1